MKKRSAFLLSILIFALCGCGSEETDQDCPPYFQTILQEFTTDWMDYSVGGHPTSSLMEALGDSGVTNGGREEDGIFTCFIKQDNDAEGEYASFDLKELLTDAEEWNWASAGAFCDEDKGKTYICYYDFNDLTEAGERDPQLILVEFDTDQPTNYRATPYSVEPRDSFSWYCECYRIDDNLYVAGEDTLGVINLSTGEFEYCRDEYALAEEFAQKVIGEETYYMRTFRAILQQDDVTVYSAEIAEANDSPAVGMIFVAIRDNQPIAYMSVDLTAEDITQGVKIATAE